jgi:hypothetical protein
MKDRQIQLISYLKTEIFLKPFYYFLGIKSGKSSIKKEVLMEDLGLQKD